MNDIIDWQQQADKCVKCGLCLPHCPTYRLAENEAESPRGRISMLQGLVNSAVELSPTASSALNHCLGCNRCTTSCPVPVSLPDLLYQARLIKPELRPQLSPTNKLLLALSQKSPKQLLSLGGIFALLNSLGQLQALSKLLAKLLPKNWQYWRYYPRQRIVLKQKAQAYTDEIELFIGCINSLADRNSLAAAYKLADKLALRIIPSELKCCGLLAKHYGQNQQPTALTSTADTLYYLNPACGNEWQHRPTQELTSLLLSKITADLSYTQTDAKVLLQLPCSLNYSQAQLDNLLNCLRKIAPTLAILKPETGCCGAAGSHMLDDPDHAQAVLKANYSLQQLEQTDILLSFNFSCGLHIKTTVGSRNSKLKVMHPLELLAQFYS